MASLEKPGIGPKQPVSISSLLVAGAMANEPLFLCSAPGLRQIQSPGDAHKQQSGVVYSIEVETSIAKSHARSSHASVRSTTRAADRAA